MPTKIGERAEYGTRGDGRPKGEPGLLPCPFCGNEAIIIEGRDGESAYVQCLGMKMHKAMWFDGDNNAANEVRDEWNRRAHPTLAEQGEGRVAS